MSVQIISFNCTLKNKVGTLISTTFNKDIITSPDGQNGVLEGLAKGLQNLTKGEKRVISLSAEEAYGFYDPRKVVFFPKEKLPAQIHVGQMVALLGKDEKVRHYKVLQINDHMVTLDGNHPLAGQDLIFEIETLSAREATPEEISESQPVFTDPSIN